MDPYLGPGTRVVIRKPWHIWRRLPRLCEEAASVSPAESYARVWRAKADVQRAAAGFKIRWYELELECGHIVERTAKSSSKLRGYARMHHLPPRDSILPGPKRVKCEHCER